MTNNIPKICAAFEMWQDDDCIKASTTLELIMRYLADDLEIDYTVSNADRFRAYRDYIKRQDEKLNAKTLIILELNKDREVFMKAVEIIKGWKTLSGMVNTYNMQGLRDIVIDYLDEPVKVWALDSAGGKPGG